MQLIFIFYGINNIFFYDSQFWKTYHKSILFIGCLNFELVTTTRLLFRINCFLTLNFGKSMFKFLTMDDTVLGIISCNGFSCFWLFKIYFLYYTRCYGIKHCFVRIINFIKFASFASIWNFAAKCITKVI